MSSTNSSFSADFIVYVPSAIVCVAFTDIAVLLVGYNKPISNTAIIKIFILFFFIINIAPLFYNIIDNVIIS